MIRRYVYGNTIETEAIPVKPEICREELPFLRKSEKALNYTMKPDDIIYGLGENVRGINKRGWVYISNCTDEPNHREDTRSLYGAHNFIIVSGQETFGLFLDTPGVISFDIGYTKYDQLAITVSDENYELFLMEGETPDEITTQFRTLIGPSYLPPKWAFGFGQSRWGYQTAEQIRAVVKKHRQHQIPLDSVYLDIDYMERYKNFTINQQNFPDFEQFVAEMKAENIHLVPIIDAAVKIESGYDVYEEGVANNYFCKDIDGDNFTIGVWPGKCHFPDMLDQKAREWFGDKYKILLDQGIDGFWNDMNEPAIFYSEKRLIMVFDKLDEYRRMNLDINTFFEFQDLVSSLPKNSEDYQSFYHHYRGQKIKHDQVHNLYGYYMTRAAQEAFERWLPDKRILMFSRASYIGMHRYGGIWTGDNLSWWSHIALNMKMLPSLNMCGFLYCGADIGGFGADATEDLVLRWLALGIFTPLMRNHSAKGTREQEFYQFEHLEAFRDLIGLRYRLLPYLYSEYMKAALTDSMLFRPLGFWYPDDSTARHTEDQLFVGESIMIAPVYEQNAIGRHVYLPETMKLLRFCHTQVAEEIVLSAGHHFILVALDEVVLFIRQGHLLPLSHGATSVDSVDNSNLEICHFAKSGDYYELYDDDGYQREVSLTENIRRIILK